MQAPGLLARPLRALLLLCSLWLLVGPLALLQVGAWTWMLASYSQESSIEQAFRETFGGDRPCELCKLIEEVEQSPGEVPGLPAAELKELKLMPASAHPLFFFPVRPQRAPPADWTACLPDVFHGVPSPPPRGQA